MRGTWVLRDAAGAPRWWDGAEDAPCVVDVSFSLAPNGLFWTLALAESLPVWLPQGHWAIVDDEPFYARDARLVARLGGAPGAAGRVAFARTAGRWREAREALRLEGRRNLYWTADGWAESVVPKDDDPGLLDRRDALAAGLDARRGAGFGPFARPPPPAAGAGCTVAPSGPTGAWGAAGVDAEAPDALADCARDALALAAALGGPRPVVLAAMAEGDARPELAARLESAGVCCAPLAESPAREALRRRLMPALLRCGLAAPLAGGLLRLAGLMVVAPRAPTAAASVAESGAAPSGAGEPAADRLAWNAAAEGVEAALWDDASAIWWEVP